MFGCCVYDIVWSVSFKMSFKMFMGDSEHSKWCVWCVLSFKGVGCIGDSVTGMGMGVYGVYVVSVGDVVFGVCVGVCGRWCPRDVGEARVVSLDVFAGDGGDPGRNADNCSSVDEQYCSRSDSIVLVGGLVSGWFGEVGGVADGSSVDEQCCSSSDSTELVGGSVVCCAGVVGGVAGGAVVIVGVVAWVCSSEVVVGVVAAFGR